MFFEQVSRTASLRMDSARISANSARCRCLVDVRDMGHRAFDQRRRPTFGLLRIAANSLASSARSASQIASMIASLDGK